jgi:PPM family protein phosphatase
MEAEMKKMEGQVVCGGHTLVYAGMSHKGQVRKINEDDFLIMPEFQIFCVADGMGGYERGEVASRLTVEAIGQYIENLAETSSENHPPRGELAYRSPWLEKAIYFANDQVVKASAGSKMGSTIVIGHFVDNYMEVGHVGDSRAYRLRNRELQQLTEDHSLVYNLYKMGHITQAQMRNHPHKNVVTQALGPDPKINPGMSRVDVLPGDLFLYCSDGLSGMVDDAAISRILSSELDIVKALDQLILVANQAGGLDNITAILVAVK